MISWCRRLLAMSSTASGSTTALIRPLTGILPVTLLVVSCWSVGGAAAAPPPIPPWYSSDSIHVKFRDGVDVDLPEVVLPPGLRNRMAGSTKLFKLPKQRLNELRAKGMGRSGKSLPDLNLWFQITLPEGGDAAAFLEDLKRLPNVEFAEPAPLPQIPPAATPDFERYQARMRRVLARADVVKGSDEDFAYLALAESPEATARSLLAQGVGAVLLTQGADVARAFCAGGEVSVPVPKVAVVDTVGAGDTFGGAFLAWWLERGLGRKELADIERLEEAVTFAVRAAAINCTRAGAEPPTREEMGLA